MNAILARRAILYRSSTELWICWMEHLKQLYRVVLALNGEPRIYWFALKRPLYLVCDPNDPKRRITDWKQFKWRSRMEILSCQTGKLMVQVTSFCW